MKTEYITPGKIIKDIDGKPIQAHGAAMFYENGTYYWYGENKEKTDGKNGIWTWGIRFYSSKDLCSWKDEGLVIPPDTEDETSSLHPSRHIDRPHILYNPKTKQYVCWLKLSEERGYFTILCSEKLLGPYRIVKDQYCPYGMAAGDFDLWQDTDGNGYLFFEHDHAGVITTGLTPDYLDVQGEHYDLFTGVLPPYTREGVTHLTHGGKHYLLTSGMTGYVPNPSEAAVSDNPLGPYRVLGNPHRNDRSFASFNSQISYVFQHPEYSNFYLTMADRWVPEFEVTQERYEQIERVVRSQYDKSIQPSEADYLTVMEAPFLSAANTSIATYVWLPLIFEADMPVIEWQDVWKPEEYMR